MSEGGAGNRAALFYLSVIEHRSSNIGHRPLASGPELADLTQEARELTKIFAASARTARAKERQSQPAKPRRRTRTTAQDPSMTDDR
jgi:hypothetical protein